MVKSVSNIKKYEVEYRELIQELRNGNLDMLVLNLPMKETKDLKIQKVMDVQDIFVGNKKYYELTKGNIKLEIFCIFIFLTINNFS